MLLQAEDLGRKKRKWHRCGYRVVRAAVVHHSVITIYYVPTRIIILYLCAYNIVFLGSPPGADDKAVCSNTKWSPRAGESYTHHIILYTGQPEYNLSLIVIYYIILYNMCSAVYTIE